MQLEAKNLVKTFGSKRVLEGISFTAEGGKALGLLGRNGAGKTTTIRILMQVFPCDEGVVLLDGKPLDVSAVRFGYLPEERGLYPKRRITEQLVYLGELRGLTRQSAQASAQRLLSRLGMSEYAEKKLETLSKGNQQKIQLAAALVSDPDIVVLDEPFSGLDPVNARLLKDVVNELIATGKIVIFSSHQMNYIEEFCENIAILHQGRLVCYGKLSDIKHSYERNRIMVSSPQVDALKSALTSSEFSNVAETADERTLLVTLPSSTQKAELYRFLGECGVEIDEFRVYEPSLNDIFVDYTKDMVEVNA